MAISSDCVARAEIDFSAMGKNYSAIRKKIGNREIIPVVKANAYGHGMEAVSKFLASKPGVKRLGVARVNEGVRLRTKAVKIPLIILGGFTAGEIPDIIKYRLEPSVYSRAEASALSSAALKKNTRVNVHVKVNTGMNRLGVPFGEAPGFILFAARLKGINIKSVYTHFANADLPADTLTLVQAERLGRAAAVLNGKKIIVHAANSAAIARYPFTWFDAVRPGLALYGAAAGNSVRKKMPVSPVMTLKAKVINTIKLKKGEAVSYGGIYRAKKDENIAIIGIGYGDGFRRELSNKWYILIKGKKCPVAGRVCMDMTAVKTGPGVKIGDEALILGRSKQGEIKVEDIAAACGTIPYEIFTGITERVKRIYKK